MTRDEILAMPAGQEMDALVAEKVMTGLPWCTGKHYSTDIAAAWEVVNEMGARNMWAYLGVLSSYSYAVFTGAQSPIEHRAEAGVNEVPLAICRAALVALSTG